MDLLYTSIAICAVFDLAAGAYDAHETNIGVKKGSGIEGNTIINFLSGTLSTRKPKPLVVTIYNVLKTALITSLALTGNPALVGGSIGGLVASGASHLQAAGKWKYLNNGGQIDRTKSYTWWQKLLGIGWE